jgi:hypothetical protein
MKTVTHKGKEYQIGKLYLFGDKEGEGYHYGILEEIHEGFDSVFFEGEDAWKFCDEVSIDLVGTIKEAPIELEDGCAYQFHSHDGAVTLNFGLYRSQGDAFESGVGVFSKHKCTNIVKLVPEVK